MAKSVKFQSEVLDREFTYEIPFRVTCIVTGLVKTYTLESYINRVIDRFGGLEKLHLKYVCKDAKRMLKEGKTVEEVINTLNPPKEETPAEEPAVESVSEEITAPVMETTEPTPEAIAEKMEEIFQEVEEVIAEQVEEVITKPLAKKDAKGKYRNSRGHVITADKLELYHLQD